MLGAAVFLSGIALVRQKTLSIPKQIYFVCLQANCASSWMGIIGFVYLKFLAFNLNIAAGVLYM